MVRIPYRAVCSAASRAKPSTGRRAQELSVDYIIQRSSEAGDLSDAPQRGAASFSITLIM